MSLLKPHPTLVCVIVYNRLENIRLWLHAWKSMLKPECKLAVIHNKDRHDESIDFERVSLSMGADYYLKRRNKGFDIGALKDLVDDVIKPGNFQYELLHWCVDDSLPMRQDSVVQFQNALLQDGVGLVGSQMSYECTRHLRTNAFMVRRETMKKIVFPCERSNSMYKDHCYAFEHGGRNFKMQVEDMGLEVKQVNRDVNYYYWDIGHLGRYHLWNKFYDSFGVPSWASPALQTTT
jgi:hypothetical protein